jgi:hypothetical protein
MSLTARAFSDTVQRKLDVLSSRVRVAIFEAAPTRLSLQMKLDDARGAIAARRQVIQTARDQLQKWCQLNESEKRSTVTMWKETRETRKLANRTKQAEDNAIKALQIMEASIDEAERMILEAIAARLDESAESDGEPDLGNWYVWR